MVNPRHENKGVVTMKKLITAAAAFALALSVAGPGFAAGKKTGFGSETTSTQGNSGKENPNANPDNEGQTVTETSGPRGQLKQGNTDCNNCSTETVSLPGKSR
jgi:hypothetical protein